MARGRDRRLISGRGWTRVFRERDDGYAYESCDGRRIVRGAVVDDDDLGIRRDRRDCCGRGR